jgi:hypothetical protein
VSGTRLIIGAVVMGIALPAALFYLLHLRTTSQFLTVSAATFVTWGVADVLALILERPRLKNRTPTAAWREDMERRQSD